MRVFRWLVRQFNYNERCRQIDITVLWPVCRDQARDVYHAKAAFAFHCCQDRAWRVLGFDEIARRIDEL